MAVSKKIKGISIEIGGNTTSLEKALSSVDGKSRKLQSELTAINKSLKFNPDNVELLGQKQQVLSQTIENTKDKLEALKAAQEKAEKAFKANAEWERLYAPIKEQIDATTETLQKLKSKKEQVDQKFQSGKISAEEYQAYNQKVEETEKTLKELNKAKKDLDKQFTDGHISESEYNEFRREIIYTESSLKSLENRLTETNKSINQNNSHTAKLKETMSAINGTSSKLKKELQDVDKALKLDPKNVVLLQQKQEILNESIANAKNKVNALKDAQQKVNEMFKNGDIGADEYREFERELVSAESSLKSYENQLAETNKSIKQNNSQTGKLKEILSTVGNKTSELKEKLHSTIDKLKSFGEVAQKVATVSLKSLETGINSVGKVAETGIKGFEKYTAALTATVTAVSTFAVKSGATFETSMSKVQSLSGATGDDLKQLEEKAKEMGASTSKSASESADALGYMALAGWNTEQMLDGLEPILRASEAGAMDLATCSDLVTDSMSTLGFTSSELSHYLDVVTKTQASANTSMQGMLEAYVGCGGTLKNLEIPLETSATLIGVLANRGIKGSEAGTSLNSVLVNLMGVSGQASEALDSLGVSMYENGKRRDVIDMLTELNGKLAELDRTGQTDKKDAFTAMIGGKTQMDTLQALLDGLNNEYGELNGKISDCDGYMLEAAKTMQDNVQGAFTALKSASEGAGIAIYDTFKDKLKNTLQEVTGYVSSMTESINENGILGLVDSFYEIKTKIIESIINSIPDIVNGIASSALAFNSAIISAVDVVIGVLPQLTSKVLPSLLTTFFQLIDKLIDRIPELVPQLINAGTMLVSGILEGMLKSAEKLTEIMPNMLKTIDNLLSSGIPNIFQIGVKIIKALVNGILDLSPVIISSAVSGAGSIVSSLINAVISLLPDILNTGIILLESILNGIINALPELITTVQTCISSMLQTIMEHLPQILQAGVDILFSIINGIIEMLPELLKTGIVLLESILNGILSALPELIVTIKSCVSSMLQIIMEHLPEILQAGIDILFAIINGIIEMLPELINTAVDLVLLIVDTILNNLDPLIEAALQLVIVLCVAILDNIDKIFDYIPKLVESIMRAIIDNLDLIIQAAIEILITIGTTLISSVAELTVFIPQVIDAIVKAFTDTDWKKTGSDIMNGIFDGILEIGEKATSVLKPAVNKISEFLNGGISKINELIDGINSVEIGDMSLNIPHIPEIPMLANGGILSSGSAIVGEAGAELLTVANGRAVVQPLTNNNQSVANNINYTTDNRPVFNGNIDIPVYLYPNSSEFSRAVVTATQINAAMTGGR